MCVAMMSKSDTFLEIKKIVADSLSRAAVPRAEEEGYEVFQEINLILSVSEERYEKFKKPNWMLSGRQIAPW